MTFFKLYSILCQVDGTEEPALLRHARRLHLAGVALLVRAGCDVSVVDEERRNALWHATLPPRTRARGVLEVVIRRVRGVAGEEERRREQLVNLLLEVGVPLEEATLENMGRTMGEEMAGRMMAVRRVPRSLVLQCRQRMWDVMREGDRGEDGGWVNVRTRIGRMKERNILPASLATFLLYDDL